MIGDEAEAQAWTNQRKALPPGRGMCGATGALSEPQWPMVPTDRIALQTHKGQSREMRGQEEGLRLALAS